MSETFTFEGDVPNLLNTVFNPLLTNKEIFLRELILNAADAMTIIQDEAVSDPGVLEMEQELAIRVTLDKENDVLTVEDSGVGMTKRDLIHFLGTVSRSGTLGLLEAREDEGRNPDPLHVFGRFGIGFYSAFCVSYKVRVVSKCYSDIQYIWESEVGGPFTVSRDADMMHGEINRGSKVICFLKEDSLEFLDETILDELLTRHSESIGTSIVLVTKRRFGGAAGFL